MASQELLERVLVVPRSTIDPFCPAAFGRETEQVRAAALKHCHFLERTIAEQDFSHKQIIPYILIQHGNKYLLIRRTRKQTESRLHDKYSLGIGGHINDEDVGGQSGDIIEAGLRRELEEEIQLEDEQSCRLVGVINDDSTEVSRVHMGLVHVLNTSSPAFTIAEKDKYTADWKTPEEMLEHYDHMESWAQIVFDCVICTHLPDRAKKWETPR
jgi:predicted NUDIX family phosphoesterase